MTYQHIGCTAQGQETDLPTNVLVRQCSQSGLASIWARA